MQYEDVDPTKPIIIEFNETNPNWSSLFSYNRLFVQMTLSMCNERMSCLGYVFLNDVLVALGEQRMPEGQLVGWLKAGYNTQIKHEMFESSKRNTINLHLYPDGMVWDKIGADS